MSIFKRRRRGTRTNVADDYIAAQDYDVYGDEVVMMTMTMNMANMMMMITRRRVRRRVRRRWRRIARIVMTRGSRGMGLTAILLKLTTSIGRVSTTNIFNSLMTTSGNDDNTSAHHSLASTAKDVSYT